MKEYYIEVIAQIERLHRRFLDVIKVELDRIGLENINNIQTLILYNISDETLTIGELTNRGYYLGSNVSYNIKKLVENGYLIQEQSQHDKRSFKIRLSDEGKSLYNKIDKLYTSHISALQALSENQVDLNALHQNLKNLEGMWDSQMRRF